MNNDIKYICCRCTHKFKTIIELEDHNIQEYLEVYKNSGVEEHNFCGHRLYFCHGCEQYFKNYNLYKKHFEIEQKCLHLDLTRLLTNCISWWRL